MLVSCSNESLCSRELVWMWYEFLYLLAEIIIFSLVLNLLELLCSRIKFLLNHIKTCTNEDCSQWCKRLRQAYSAYKLSKEGEFVEQSSFSLKVFFTS